MTEQGADWQHNGGEYVTEGELDFDVWAYVRPLGGWTFVVRQEPPNQMTDDTGVLRVGLEQLFSLDVAGGLEEHHPRLQVEPRAERRPWDDVPADIQAFVFAAASTGWVWCGVERIYNPGTEQWEPA